MAVVEPDSSDLVILGGGSGGYACALRAAQLGLSVTLVEVADLGGTCLHRGCIPTKAWLHAGEVADTVRDSSQFGIGASLDVVDAAAVRDYADGVVARLFKGLTGLVEGRGVTVVAGHGRLEVVDGRPAVRVGDRLLHGAEIVLATGSTPRSLPGIVPDGVRILTSDHALRLESLPQRAIILGGGVIGCEFASAWRSLGVEVTVVEAMDRLLPSEEPAISTALARTFRRRRIQQVLGRPVESVHVADDGVRVQVDGGAAFEADLVLVAVGRGPVSEGLGYPEAGVGLDRGWVRVDERLRTAVPGIRAVGDLVPGLQLAHRGFAHGLFVAEDVAHQRGLLPEAPQPVVDERIPRVTYTEPEVASVGLTQVQAEERYGAVETATYDLAGNGRSQILKTSGSVHLVRAPDGPVVGVHLIGSRVSELIGEAQLIVGWQAHPEDVVPLVHAHPTQGEALGEAVLALAGQPLHAHG